MKLFFKVLSAALVFTAFSGLLSSCNVPEPLPTATMTPDWTPTAIPPTTTPTKIPTPTVTPLPDYLDVPEDDLAGTELILQYNLYGEARSTLEELVQRFNDENTIGITVQAKDTYSINELETNITSGDSLSPDLVIADSAWLRSINTDGTLFLELSAFLNDPRLGLEGEELTPLMPVMLEIENRDEKFYAIPLWTEPAFLFYNKTWAIELGFEDTPGDLAAFADQACAAGKANYAEKDDGKHGTGGWIVSSDPEDVMSWLLIFSQTGTTPGEMIRSNAGDVFSEAASWLRNLYDNGCAWNSRVKEPYDYFANRYALFYSGTYSDADRQLNAFDQSEEHSYDNWDLIPYPVKTTGNGSNPRIYANAVSIAICSESNQQKMNAAWRFIRWLYEEEHAAELALAALGWPVQDNDSITKLYRGSGRDKLYQTLSYRQYLVNSDAHGNWLTDQMILSDGFAYIFNPSAKPEDIPEIWDQIGSLIAEIDTVNHLSEGEKSETDQKTGVNNETQP